MREIQSKQMEIGEVDISKIVISLNSRDDIPTVLRGLQYLCKNDATCKKIFALLETELMPNVDKNNGRPGMNLWAIFVCGVVRLNLNIDYDRLHELVNHHDTLRLMLGHSEFDKKEYHYQTLNDNVRKFTPDLLNKINQVVVNAGHEIAGQEDDESLHARCDSFVVETNVHFPTDIHQAYDATRKTIELSAQLSEMFGMSDWRQHAYNIRHLKRSFRSAQNTKHRKGRNSEQTAKNDEAVIKEHKTYIDVANEYLNKAKNTLNEIVANPILRVVANIKEEIEGYISHAAHQIDQIHRRVILGEVIPHKEKVFSVFEPHTEWISKGKAGVPVELGLRVCIIEDQHRFILNHLVMEKKTDDQVAVSFIEETKKIFPDLSSCSFDKGFHSPANQQELKEYLDLVILPRKGKLSKPAQEIENAKDFVKARRQHSAVESAINALEVHGLDRCPDQGIDGFKRYISFAVLAKNIHRLGAILRDKEREQAKRQARYANRDSPCKMAA